MAIQKFDSDVHKLVQVTSDEKRGLPQPLSMEDIDSRLYLKRNSYPFELYDCLAIQRTLRQECILYGVVG